MNINHSINITSPLTCWLKAQFLLECPRHRLMGLVESLVLGIGIYLNIAVLWAFSKHKAVLACSPVRIFVQPVALFNLVLTSLTLPLVIISNFHCKWIFSDMLCSINGSLIYFKSCSIIYLMCLISYERVEVIGAPGEVANCSLSDTSSLCLVSNNVSVAYSAKKGRIVIIKIDQGDSVSMSSAMYREPNWRKMQRTSVQIWTQLKQKTSLLGKKSLREKLLIMICFLVGAVWSATPFLGWSHYSSSSIEANCVIDWKSKEPSSRSYNLATCLALFILPLSFNLLNYLKLFYHSRMFNRTQASGMYRRGTIYRLKRDLIKCRIILKTVVAIGLYCLSWLPYRLLTLCFLVIGPIELNEGVEAFSILMTHTSVIMTTLTCIFTDDNLRRIVFCSSSRPAVV